ncbi:ANF protein, partial [Todus mexicanus]|nr:ANF protein [Todus mexicanus]
MQVPTLCCRAWLLLLSLPWAGAQVACGKHDVELSSLQDLVEALEQLQEEERELDLEDKPVAGAQDGGSEWELLEAEGAPVLEPSPAQPAEGQSLWRSLLSSYRRRHFSSCFGMRMERIGAQTALGCNQFIARTSQLGAC